MNMTLKTRLGAVIGFLILLTIGVGLAGVFGMGQANEGLRTVYEDRTVALEQIASIDRMLLQNRLAVAEALRDTKGAGISQRIDLINSNIDRINKLWADYTSTYLTPEEKILADKFLNDRKSMVKGGLQPIVAALRHGKLGEALQLEAPYLALFVPVTNGVEALRALQVNEARKEFDLSTRRYGVLRTAVVTAIVLGALLAALSGVLLIRSVYRQLGGEPAYAAQIVRTIADGDLSVAVNTRANDQQSLLFAMQQMQQNLARTVGTIRQSTDTIATASGQIASGNLDLSSRTEQQASALEETASSMEELTGTVKQNADNARQANQLAATASQIAVKGGAVVAQVVETMGSINESARKIADIIGVIDGIAFQTNILALNAAVEAARAGEQGRGFAVVASEVRNLAQRSAGAAKEIKALIGDSVEKVDAGARLVDQAGATMDEVVASVKRVSDIISEITAASQEQTAGIDQINQAIMQMDDVTQQNAALVEQAAAAAASLQDQAGGLVEVVSVFKTNGTHAGLTPARHSVPARAPALAATPRTQKPVVRKLLPASESGADWKEF
ncbi:methyl-accepting chemotaxis protein [Actimicrobium sp. CCC2.4]|uniref:methyl-accepting chemotaxis protein n=1 Tax=Actimicrobium sp. CCC2.4 TaxID=3048606 RepID=UPI002AC9819D|nr:methyl-accepting chemotaxis protein [Actimicrobium sp. CCC2.4]MEB0136253.1 methyl-accepting chemotaxis protein [Actimicrobium sp. CCC2.4]WPX33598.1 methyl-accepting chemotaxis protein [Actimicrobium sp. CCC2.4]